MYKSPIEILNSFSDSLTQRFVEETDKLVLTAVYNIGVKVDKDELIKALKYDRDQYEKGYRDGKESAAESAVVHAHWNMTYDSRTACSNCKSVWDYGGYGQVFYCPYCGAKMDEEGGAD